MIDGHDDRRLKRNRNVNGKLCHGHITFSAKIERVTLRFGQKVKIANSQVKISTPKVFQINFLGSQLNSHGIFIFLLIKYHGRLIVYHGPIGIIAHGILRLSQQQPMMGYQLENALVSRGNSEWPPGILLQSIWVVYSVPHGTH